MNSCFYLFLNIGRIKLGSKASGSIGLFMLISCVRSESAKSIAAKNTKSVTSENRSPALFLRATYSARRNKAAFTLRGFNRKHSTCYRATCSNQESAGTVRFASVEILREGLGRSCPPRFLLGPPFDPQFFP